VYYAGPRPRPGTLPRIKLDLTIDELVALPPVNRPVGHPYSDLPDGGITANCYAYEEVFGEKVRALGERGRPRDLYDVVNLFRHGEFRPAAATLVDLLARKCAYKRIPVPTFESLQGKLEELTADWQHMLGHQLPALPPFESFWNALPEFFAWMNNPEVVGLAVPGMLASIHAVGDDELYRPAIGALRREGISGSSFIESIRFAGVNRLRVRLAYQGSSRMIEPYSLRRTRDGNIVVYAIKTESREVRSYRLDRIQNVEITREVFVPIYSVELTAGETGSIPPTSRSQLHWGSHAPVSRARAHTGPIYIYQCPMCQKKFRRKTHDPQLNPHKTEHGWPCSGRHGYFVDTLY
jgi:hypothetical protein